MVMTFLYQGGMCFVQPNLLPQSQLGEVGTQQKR